MGEGNSLSYPPPILGFGWGRIIRHWEKVYQILTTFRSNHFGNWIPILITLSCKNIWNRSILRSQKFVCFWFWHIEMTVRNWMEIILFQIRFIQIWTESLSTSTSLHTRVIHGASMLILSALAQIYFTCFFCVLDELAYLGSSFPVFIEHWKSKYTHKKHMYQIFKLPSELTGLTEKSNRSCSNPSSAA